MFGRKKLKAKIAELEKQVEDLRWDNCRPLIRYESCETEKFAIKHEFPWVHELSYADKEKYFKNAIKSEIGEKVLEYATITYESDPQYCRDIYICSFRVVKNNGRA